jgi:general secretion pathway protein F
VTGTNRSGFIVQYAVQAFHRMQSVELVFDAASEADARRQAEARGLAVVAVKVRRSLTSFGRGGRFPLLQFNQSLLILLEAGMSVVEAIDTLAQREARPEARQVLLQLHEQLGQGLSLAAALERQPDIFPALYVAGVRANERSGGLIESIQRYIIYRAQAEQVRKRIIGASIYPAMTLGVGVLVIGFLLFYVVPRFSQVFQDLGDRIPYLSRLLLQWGHFLHSHVWEVLILLLALILAAVGALRVTSVRAALMRGVLSLPRVGEQVRTYQLARFYRALGLLLQAGIPIIAALDMVIGLLPSSLCLALAGAREDIGNGRSMSDAFERHGLTTVVALRLLRVAERTGRMGEMLERTAAFHEEDTAQAMDWFVRLFEPLLMIAVGLVIGLVVMLMYAPIFELAGSLQ